MVQMKGSTVGDAASGQTPRMRKLMAVCAEVGLSKEERMELATYLLRRDVVTFKGLEDDQVDRLLDALEGYQLVTTLVGQRVDSYSPY
jgi:hypothetical protein